MEQGGPEESDVALVLRARAHDQQAFVELVRRYTPVVVGFIVNRVGLQHEEDILQEVFLDAHRQLNRLHDPKSFGPWLLRIARGKLRDFLRRQYAIHRVEIAAESQAERLLAAPEHTRPPDEQLAAAQARDAVLRAIASLREKHRVVVYLRLIEEASSVEIATRLKLKESTVRMRLQRGIEQLRRHLTKDGFGSP